MIVPSRLIFQGESRVRTHYDTTEHQHAHAYTHACIYANSLRSIPCQAPAPSSGLYRHRTIAGQHRWFADTRLVEVRQEGQEEYRIEFKLGGFQIGGTPVSTMSGKFFLIAEWYTGSNEFEPTLKPKLVSAWFPTHACFQSFVCCNGRVGSEIRDLHR